MALPKICQSNPIISLKFVKVLPNPKFSNVLSLGFKQPEKEEFWDILGAQIRECIFEYLSYDKINQGII